MHSRKRGAATEILCPQNIEEKGGEGDGYILSSFSDSPLTMKTPAKNVFTDILYNANDYVYIYNAIWPSTAACQARCALRQSAALTCGLLPRIPDSKMVYRLTQSYYASLIPRPE